VNLTTSGTPQEQIQTVDIVGSYLAEHACKNGTAAVLVSVSTHSHEGGPGNGCPAVNVSMPEVMSAVCALAARTSAEAWYSISLENVDPVVVRQILEKLFQGDLELYTSEGVPLKDLICAASTTLSCVPYDSAESLPENRESHRKRLHSRSKTAVAVACGLATLLVLMTGMLYCRRRDVLLDSGLVGLKVSSELVGLSPRSPAEGSAADDV